MLNTVKTVFVLLLATSLSNVFGQTDAIFFGSNDTFCVGEEVRFFNLSTSDGSIEISKWEIIRNNEIVDSTFGFNYSSVFNSDTSLNIRLIVCNDNNDCDTASPQDLVVRNPELPLIEIPQNVVCVGDEIQINLLNADRFRNAAFYTNDGQRQVFNPAVENSVTFTNFNEGIRDLLFNYQDIHGCSSTFTFKDSIGGFQQPRADFTVNPSVDCDVPAEINITDASTGVSPFTYQYEIDGQSFTTSDFTINLTGGGYDVSLVIIDANNCVDSITKRNAVKISQLDDGYSFNNTTFCLNDTLELISNTNVVESYWIFNSDTIRGNDVRIPLTDTGSFDLVYEASDANNCFASDTQFDFIRVNPLPEISFVAIDSYACTAPRSVDFIANTPNAVSWNWRFNNGSGTTSTQQNPTNIPFANEGVYTVDLTVTDNLGCTNTFSKDSAVVLQSFVPQIEADTQQGCVPLTVNYSYVPNPLTQTLGVSWDVNNDNAIDGNGLTYQHIFNDTGCFDLQVTVFTDACTQERLIPEFICSGDTSAEPLILDPDSLCMGERAITLVHSGNHIDERTFFFTDSFFETTTDTFIESKVFESGRFQPKVITNHNGCIDTVLSDSLISSGIKEDITLTVNPDNPNDVLFDVTVSGVNLFIVYGDGSFTSPPLTSSQQFTKTYNDLNRDYTVIFAANDGNGCTSQEERILRLPDTSKALAFNQTEICPNDTIIATNLFGSTSGDSNSIFIWKSVNDATEFRDTGLAVQRVFATADFYTVELININTVGKTDTLIAADTIKVYGVEADFTADITNGCAPITTHFSNSSVSVLPITFFNYDFGDGNASTDENPSHTYLNADALDVQLIATNSFGCADTTLKTSFIVTDSIPTFTFEKTLDSACLNQTIQFLASPDLNYNWTFENASLNTSTADTVSNNFNAIGFQTVQLIGERNGCSDTLIDSVFIYDFAAGFTVDKTISNQPNVFFLFNDTTANSINSFWQFNNDETSNLTTLFHQFASYGTFEAKLIATSFTGCSDSVTENITIVEPAATISILDSFYCPGDEVEVVIASENLMSFDVFPGGGMSPISVSTGLSSLPGSSSDTVRFIPPTPNKIKPIVVAENGNTTSFFTSIDSVIIDSVGIEIEADETILCGADTVCLNTLITYRNDGFLIDSFIWNYDNGETSLEDSNCVRFETGTYEVELTVVSTKGCRINTTQEIQVFDSLISILEVDRTTICLGDSSFFSDSNKLDKPIVAVEYDFGDGNTTVNRNPDYLFTDTGLFTVQLTYTDIDGCIDSTSVDIRVNPVPNVQLEPRDTFFCEGDSFLLVAHDAEFYNWQPRDFLTDSRSDSTLAFPPTDTTYVVFATNSLGCGSVDSITLRRNRITPKIDFLANCAGDTSTFGDTSTIRFGQIDQWHWDFDNNGATDSVQFPKHVFKNEGFYDVQVTVTDSSLGCSFDTIINVNIIQTVFSRFSFTSVCNGDSVSFTDESFSTEGEVISWLWDFGDGTTSTLQNPKHLFAEGDTFSVTLTVSNNAFCMGVQDTTIDVEVFPNPFARFATNDVCFGDSTFIRNDALANGIGYPITAVRYDLDIEPTEVTLNTDTNQFNYQYPYPDTFFVTQIVTNNKGCIDSAVEQTIVYRLPESNFPLFDICAKGDVNFTNNTAQGDGLITDYLWDFGTNKSNNTSDEFEPTFSFDTFRVYNVQLTTTDAFGCTDDTINQVRLQRRVIALFDADTACLGNSTSFTDQSILLQGNSLTNWLYQFGDLNASTLANPSHIYADPGVFPVRLEVTTDEGCKNDTTLLVRVYQTPTAIFNTADTCEIRTVFLENLTEAGDFFVDQYQWSFDALNGPFSNEFEPQFAYPEGGDYTIELQVTDEFGCTDTTSTPIHIFENPIASFFFDNPCEKSTVQFTDISIEQEGAVKAWKWNFGTSVPFDTSIEQHPTFQYFVEGIYPVNLEVTDTNNCFNDITVPVTILPKPTANFNFRPNDDHGCSNEDVCIVDFSDPTSTNGFSAWDWTVTGAGTDTSDEQNPCFALPTPTTYTVELIVTDDNLCTDTIQRDYEVFEAPIANFTHDSICIEGTLRFEDLSTEGAAPLTQWFWFFPEDSTTDFRQEATRYYGELGEYDVQLVVRDTNSCKDTATSVVAVVAPIEVSIAANRDVLCPGDSTFVIATTPSNSLSWTPTQDIYAENVDTIFIQPAVTTTFRVVADAGPCPAPEAQTTVRVLQPVTIDFEVIKNPINKGDRTQIEATINGIIDSVRWTPNTQLSCDFCLNPVASPLQDQVYNTTVWYSEGATECSVSDSVFIEVLQACDDSIVFIPNTFTPNFDNLNDIFYVRGVGVSEVTTFDIYSRAGKKVFSASGGLPNDPEFGWDGTFRGEPINNGVYLYQISVICFAGGELHFSGEVNLVK